MRPDDRGQLIFDVQIHFVHPACPSKNILALRDLASPWNPQLKGEQTLADKLIWSEHGQIVDRPVFL